MLLVCRTLVILCLLATITSTLRVYPHQLAYFNEAAGGPENGWKHLLHSNLDWGQDLLLVNEWLSRHKVDPHTVHFASYFPYPAEPLVLPKKPRDVRNSPDWIIATSDQLCGAPVNNILSLRQSHYCRIGHTTWVSRTMME
jgi:hypothetical protein